VLFTLIHFVSVLSTLHTFFTQKKYAKKRWDSEKRAIIFVPYTIVYHVFSVPNPAVPYIGFLQAVFDVTIKR
jgi:hypothetical protein